MFSHHRALASVQGGVVSRTGILRPAWLGSPLPPGTHTLQPRVLVSEVGHSCCPARRLCHPAELRLGGRDGQEGGGVPAAPTCCPARSLHRAVPCVTQALKGYSLRPGPRGENTRFQSFPRIGSPPGSHSLLEEPYRKSRFPRLQPKPPSGAGANLSKEKCSAAATRGCTAQPPRG